MSVATECLDKMDDALAYVMGANHYHEDERVPVAFSVDAAELENVLAAIEEHDGVIRHVLRLVSAVAAWVPIKAIAPLSELAAVHSVELDQQMHIA